MCLVSALENVCHQTSLLFYLEFISTFLALHTLFSQSKPCFTKQIEIGISPLSIVCRKACAPTGNIVSVSSAVLPTVLFWSKEIIFCTSTVRGVFTANYELN
uniref:Uncharacterized protein n=1 Tax=Arundo donax TaxID=35708 RepID=A0A0A9SXI2_ARUDO